MTVHEAAALAGVSVRTLQYYDKIGLLPPATYSPVGYRLYDGEVLERLQQILLFRELEFPLKEIRAIVESPAFDRDRALEQQIDLLTLKKKRLERLISLARELREKGGTNMDFSAFDSSKLEEYAAQAKAAWGETPEYRESRRRSAKRTPREEQALGEEMMAIFAAIGERRADGPDDPQIQALVEKLQGFITEHYYPCTDEMLSVLGEMYASGGEFTANIDRAGGPGTAELTAQAIRHRR